MTDERVRLVQKVNGLSELRVHEDTLNELGQAGLAAELITRGYQSSDLGTPAHYPLRREWRIPLRKATDD